MSDGKKICALEKTLAEAVIAVARLEARLDTEASQRAIADCALAQLISAIESKR